MDSLDNSQDALAYLKAKRTPEPSQEAQSEESEAVEEETAEAEEVEEVEGDESASADLSDEDDEEPGVYLIDDEEVTLIGLRAGACG